QNFLTLRYALSNPSAPAAVAPVWDAKAGMATWSFAFDDLLAARFLEQWFPANLIHDRLKMTLDLELLGAKAPHVLITNGDAEGLADSHYRVVFPAHYTAQSPMLLLVPESALDASKTVVNLPGGTPISLELFAEKEATIDLASVAGQVTNHLAEWSQMFGSYP